MSSVKSITNQTRVALLGSEKLPLTTGSPVTVDNAGPLHVTVILQRKREPDSADRVTREEFAQEYGPDPEAVPLLDAFARHYALAIAPNTSGDPASFTLTGTEAAMQEAFGVTLTYREVEGCTYRVREGAIYLPDQLAAHVTAVLGLDNRPQSQHRVATGNVST